MTDKPWAGKRIAHDTTNSGEHPSLAQILKVAFDTIWRGGLTFDDAYRRRGMRRVRTA
jgi:hypothetical protein